MRTQLSEREIMIYLLVEQSKLSNRKIAEALGISHENVRKAHNNASAKMKFFADAGLFSTQLKKL